MPNPLIPSHLSTKIQNLWKQPIEILFSLCADPLGQFKPELA